MLQADLDALTVVATSSDVFPSNNKFIELLQKAEYEIAQQCLARAKRLSPNVAKQCMISATIAEMHDKMVSSA